MPWLHSAEVLYCPVKKDTERSRGWQRCNSIQDRLSPSWFLCHHFCSKRQLAFMLMEKYCTFLWSATLSVSSLSTYCTTHPHIQPLSRKKAAHLHDQTELTQTAECPAPALSGFCTVNCNCSLARVRVHVLENLSGLIKREAEACCTVLIFTAGATSEQLQLWLVVLQKWEICNFYQSGHDSEHRITAF